MDVTTAAHALIRRQKSAQQVLDEGTGKPWRLGEHDCARMTAAHLRRLGYRVKLPAKGSYRTLKGAKAALRQHGHADLGAALIALGLPEIAPAAAIVGDVIELEAHEGLTGLTIALGNGRVAGFYEDGRSGVVTMQPHRYLRAWRADPVERR